MHNVQVVKALGLLDDTVHRFVWRHINSTITWIASSRPASQLPLLRSEHEWRLRVLFALKRAAGGSSVRWYDACDFRIGAAPRS
jgi:hypothetical protein